MDTSRLEACRSLGWTEIPAHVVDLTEIVRGEFAENVVRKDFLPSEMVALAEALKPAEAEAARERHVEQAKVSEDGSAVSERSPRSCAARGCQCRAEPGATCPTFGTTR